MKNITLETIISAIKSLEDQSLQYEQKLILIAQERNNINNSERITISEKTQCEQQIRDLRSLLYLQRQHEELFRHNPEYSEPIINLCLSARAYNCLTQNNINLISDLCLYGKENLFEIKNLGVKSVEEIVQKLELKYEIHLPESNIFYPLTKCPILFTIINDVQHVPMQ